MTNCNSNENNSSKFNSLLAINLSNKSSDEAFILLQVLKINDNSLIIDVRKTNYGAKTKEGFTLLPQEYNWFRKAFSSIDFRKYTLQHNQRKTIMEKANTGYTITQTNSKNIETKLVINPLSLVRLIEKFPEIDRIVFDNAEVMGISLDIDPSTYYLETENP